jgi:hypothetical protein
LYNVAIPVALNHTIASFFFFFFIRHRSTSAPDLQSLVQFILRTLHPVTRCDSTLWLPQPYVPIDRAMHARFVLFH